MQLNNLFKISFITLVLLLISLPNIVYAQTLDSPDLDGNGTVNGADMQMLLPNYVLVGSAGFIASDVNQNGKVEMADAAVIVKYFSASVASPSPTTSPLPSPSGGSNGTLPVKIGTGAYPAIAVDSLGNAHVVYAKDGKLIYCKYIPTASPGSECPAQEVTGFTQNASYRNDPDIVIDSQNRPHVVGGTGNGGGQYAYLDGSSWVKIGAFNRDTAIAVDGQDNIYISQRGTTTNYVQVFKKASAATSFTQLTVPQVGAENEHVYTDMDASKTDSSLYVVYRHGLPTKCSSLISYDSGSTWINIGIYGDDIEAPGVTVGPQNKVYAICGSGMGFEKISNSWVNLDPVLPPASPKPIVSGGSRTLPMIKEDLSGNLYASVFGGKYNIRKNGAWTGEKTVTGLSTQAKGFMRVGGAVNFAYAVWEEGNSNPVLDATTAAFDIVLGKIQ